jgi:hypothetical protein
MDFFCDSDLSSDMEWNSFLDGIVWIPSSFWKRLW